MDNAGGVEQPKRYVAIFYVLAAITLGLFLEAVFVEVLSLAHQNDSSLFGLEGWHTSTALGFAVAAAVAVVVWRIPRTQNHFCWGTFIVSFFFYLSDSPGEIEKCLLNISTLIPEIACQFFQALA